jgi:Flp pilus assembly pilin Flp
MKPSLHHRRAKSGQTLVEYALIIAFISVVAISVLINVGTSLRSLFSTINSQIKSAQSTH